MDVPNSLRQRYSEGRLVPFLGAGISMSVTWQGGAKSGISWRELVDQAALMEGFTEPDLLRVRGNDLQILEYYSILNDNRFDRLNAWFTREMNPTDDEIRESPILEAITKLRSCPLIYTTNFDDFIERALRLAGLDVNVLSVEADVARSLKRSAPRNNQSVDLVKFHGDLSHTDRMILSEEDYDKRMRFVDVEDTRLQADLLGRAVLFIGYSFRDYNVSYLFRETQGRLGRVPESADGTRAYIALFDASEFERRLFRKRNIEVISLDSHLGKTEQTIELLESLTND